MTDRTMCAQYCISFADVEKARVNIQDFIHLTPVLTSFILNQVTGRNLFFKCELFQKTGSFKSRENVTRRILEETEGIMVHPNQEPAVIAGQGTIAMEVLNQIPLIDALVVPVGGGGMVAGIAITVKALRPSVKVYAAEPLNADDCYQSKLKGELTPNPYPPETIADGVKSSIGSNTWPIIRDLVDDVFTVTEDEIKYATQLVWERMKLLIEPTAGVGVAAVLSQHFQTVSPEVKNICIVLSGGNVDLTSLTWVKQAERPAPYQSVSV
ncbi:serine racemase isoform X3 [Felis catus]|uniref:serine racemase isoform X3 n=1 Tax=Felis catus TaxID=9685 RepID=UPI001D199A15|nr:serine racemase isoform X3 [Felis catus]